MTFLIGVTPSTGVTQSVGVTPSTGVTQSVNITPSTSVTQSPVQATPQMSPVTPPKCISFETVTSVILTGVLDSEEIKFLKAKSCSCRNFVVGLV